MDYEKVRKATEMGDDEELARLQEEFLSVCESNLKRFMSEGAISVPHAIVASTLGIILSESEEEIPKHEKEFKLNALNVFMERHGISIFKDMGMAVPGDVIEIDTQRGNQTYVIESVSKNKLKLIRTATSFEECRGSKNSIDRGSKNILFGLHMDQKKTSKSVMFFFYN